MNDLTSAVNTPLKLYFKSTTGQTSFSDFVILNNGVAVVSPTYTVVETPASSGIYVVTYTPIATGYYAFHAAANIFAYVNVVSRTVYSYLTNIEDEALGSWSWNKQTGVLTTYRQDGSVFHTFNVVENITTASRELVS